MASISATGGKALIRSSGRIEGVRDGVLLLPERGPWKVVEQRVRQALRQSRGRDEQVEMREDRESRERGDGPIVESVVQSGPRGARPGSRTVRHHQATTPTIEHGDDDDRTRPAASIPHGRESKRDGDDLRRDQDVDGEEGDPTADRGAGSSTRALRLRRRGQTQAQGRCARVLRLTRSPRPPEATTLRRRRAGPRPPTPGGACAVLLRTTATASARGSRRVRVLRSGAGRDGRRCARDLRRDPLSERGGGGRRRSSTRRWEGIRRSGRAGEVIVVDNASSDRSALVAAEHGARVVREQRRGYGSAYLAGLAEAQGDFIVMGDADETYPMQELAPFVDRLEQGDDLVLGSRFEGTIHGEAMPWLNRQDRQPDPDRPVEIFFGVKISDAHCGMRAVRNDGSLTLDRHSTGMEFASEMVFKAFRRSSASAKSYRLLPLDGESKLNRFGDAWRHVKLHARLQPSWHFLFPAHVLLAVRLGGALALAAARSRSSGDVEIHTLFFFMFAILLGMQVVQLWISARAFAAADLGETDRTSSGRTAGCASSTASREPASHAVASSTCTVIFVSWAIGGFGELAMKMRPGRVHAGRCRRRGDPRLVLPQPVTMRTTDPPAPQSSSA